MLTKDKIIKEFEKECRQFICNCNDVECPRIKSVLDFLSAQYEKLIGECLPEEKEMPSDDDEYSVPGVTDQVVGYNIAIEDIRTSLQERGIKIK